MIIFLLLELQCENVVNRLLMVGHRRMAGFPFGSLWGRVGRARRGAWAILKRSKRSKYGTLRRAVSLGNLGNNTRACSERASDWEPPSPFHETDLAARRPDPGPSHFSP